MISIKVDKSNWKVDVVINGREYDKVNTMIEKETGHLYVRIEGTKLYLK